LAAVERFGDAHAAVHARATELERLRGRAGARERDRDLLAFELDEIDALDPSEADKESLLTERSRLGRIDGLRAAAGGGAEVLDPAGGEPGVGALLAEAERLADAVAGADPELDALAERLRALRIEADDLGGELRGYESGLDAEPGRLEEVETRLDLYDRLERKHGGTVAAVLAHADRCRSELALLDNSEAAIAEAEAALADAQQEESKQAAALTKTRRAAAPKLAKRVLGELEHLAMEGASFEVQLHQRDGYGPAGAERVEFLIAPNPGVPPAPLRETASGGELSRSMLALMTVADAGGARTLVFDEVDAGIGGQTARAVGERLRALAGSRQVICITHLPQIASLAERHFRIAKDAASDVALTSVDTLDDGQIVEELCRMLGADTSDAGARRHAEELLAAA
jgi:DNA repair protein RecN (Recombination protein N)